jgi:hypothetical protein
MINDLIYQLDSDIRARNIKTARAILDELRTFHRDFLDNLAQIVSLSAHEKSPIQITDFIVLMSAIIHERLAEQEGLSKEESDELAKNAIDDILRTIFCSATHSYAWTSWHEVEKDIEIMFGFKLGHEEVIKNGAVPTSVNKATGEYVIAIGTPEWDTLTDRRAELIHKKNREGLNEDEQTEYERLQQISRTALARAFPRPNRLSEANLSDVEEMLGLTEDRTAQ